jgi:hypothetical protein
MPSETFLLADDPPKEQPRKEPDPAQKLLDWLQRWPKPTITSKDIYQYAPRSIRFDRENAIKTAEILVKHGWLTPLQTHRRDWRQWQIVQKGPIVHPTVAR